MKKGLKKLIAGAATAIALALPVAGVTMGTSVGQEVKAIDNSYYDYEKLYDLYVANCTDGKGNFLGWDDPGVQFFFEFMSYVELQNRFDDGKLPPSLIP